MDLFKEIISWFGVAMSLAGFTYQAGKTILSKTTKGLSLITFGVTYVSAFLWFTFAIFTEVFQAGIVNTFVLSATGIIIFLILKNKYKENSMIPYLILIGLLIIPIAETIILITDIYVTDFVNFDYDGVNLAMSLTAGALGAGSFLPQLIKILKEKVTENLSYGLIITTLLAQIFWAMFWGMSSTTESIGTWLAGCMFASILGILQAVILYTKIKYEKINKAKVGN